MKIAPYIYQAAGRSIPQLLAFGASIAMVRQAGVEVVGQYAVSIAVATLGFGTAAAAIDTHILRGNARASVVAGLAGKTAVWLAVLPAVVAVLWYMDIPLVPGLCFYGGVLFMQLAELVVVHHRMQARDRHSVALRAVPPLLYLLLLLLFRPHSLGQVAFFFLASWCAVIPFLRGPARSGAMGSAGKVLSVVLGARSIFASIIFTQVYGNADMILLKLFLGDAASGLYKIALSFAGIALPLIGVFSFIYLSRIGEIAHRRDPLEIKAALFRQIQLNGSVGLLFFGAMFVLLPWAVPFVYGPDAVPGVGPAIALCAAAAVNSLSMAFSYTLLALAQDRVIVYAVAAAAACNLLLNLALIPHYGMMGGALASLATHTVITVSLALATAGTLHTLQGKAVLAQREPL